MTIITYLELFGTCQVRNSIQREESIEVFEPDHNQTQLFSQREFNALTRDLGPSKDAAHLYGSRQHLEHQLGYGKQFA